MYYPTTRQRVGVLVGFEDSNSSRDSRHGPRGEGRHLRGTSGKDCSTLIGPGFHLETMRQGLQGHRGTSIISDIMGLFHSLRFFLKK